VSLEGARERQRRERREERVFFMFIILIWIAIVEPYI
jgi:hypothetical protein